MITWSGEPVALNATVVNNDTADPQGTLEYAWTASPDTGAVITDADQEDASVTITKAALTGDAAVVELTLAVTLPGIGTVSKSIEIDVYDDACLAAKSTDTVQLDNTDFDGNCITGLEDFAVIALNWLTNFEITEPVPK